ncbi:MAG TPA: hypothetical protein VFH68_15555 [Polyangia bacterium]|jgi:tetratricopeptide (TPR) repeat protein|nr:hypothetical protein [Polyangia bacterium]
MRPGKAALLLAGVVVANLVRLPMALHGGERGGTGVVGVSIAHAISSEAEARKHARKANHLADINKCKLAIPEYNKALRLLREPTLLFNRAECYRRTGDTAKAVADYRKFLDQMPGAPNRVQVEAQIAALDRSGAPASKPAAARPAANARSVAPPPSSPPALPPRARSGVAPDQAHDQPAQGMPSVAERRAAEPDEPSPMPQAPALAEREPAPMALVGTTPARQVAAAESDQGSSYWWAWVLGAVVIVGGAAGTYFALKQGKTDIPSSELGNYKF